MRRVGTRWLPLAAAIAAAACSSASGAGPTTRSAATPGRPAAAQRPAATVAVRPARGGPRTVFVVSFRAGAAAAPGPGGLATRYWVSVHGPSGRGCVSSATATPSLGGTRGRARLGPGPGGRWCRGTFHGRVVRVRTPVCSGPARACPMFVVVAGTVGRFSFRVK